MEWFRLTLAEEAIRPVLYSMDNMPKPILSRDNMPVAEKPQVQPVYEEDLAHTGNLMDLLA